MKQGFTLSSLIFACMLSACGGGGGGATTGGNPGGSVAAGNSLSLDRDALILVQDVPATSTAIPAVAAEVTVTFRGAGVVVGTLPGQAVPEWLTVTALTSAASPLKIKFEGRSLYPGKFQTTLRILTGNADQTGVVSKDLPVSLIVMPKLPAEIVVDAVAAGTPVKGSFPLDSSNARLNLSSNAAWLKIETPSVTGANNIVFTADPTALAAGVHSAKITVEEESSRASKVVNVNFRVDTPKLVLRERAVAFSLIGNMSRLQRSIAIGDNGKPGLQWSAQADKAWLKFGQQTGISGGSLSVSAEASGLADGMHYATVTMTQTGEPAAAPAVLRVGVYVDRATAHSSLASATAEGMSFMFGVVADPLRPYFYHLRTDGQLHVFNMYTGALQATVQIPTARPAWMAVSSDGSRMYVLDTWKGSVYPVSLDTLEVETPVTIASGMLPDGMRFAYAELNGLPVLVTNMVSVIDARSGVTLATRTRTGTPFTSMVVQRDGKAMFAQTPAGGGDSLSRYPLSQFQGNVVISEPIDLAEVGQGAGLALDYTDTYLFSAVRSSMVGSDTTDAYRYTTALVSAGKLPAKGDASGIAVSATGAVMVSKWFDSSISVYSAGLVPLLGSQHGEHADDLTISGDGRRVAMYVQESGKRRIYFIDVP